MTDFTKRTVSYDILLRKPARDLLVIVLKQKPGRLLLEGENAPGDIEINIPLSPKAWKYLKRRITHGE